MGRIADQFRAEIAEWNKRWEERQAKMDALLDEITADAEALRLSLEEEV